MPKAHGQIRKSQIITTFGPGSLLDLPNHSVIVGGLDTWRWETPDIKDRKIVSEGRLANKLRGELGLSKIDFYEPPVHSDDPSRPSTGVTAFRFPEWYITQTAEPWQGNPSIKTRILLSADRLHRTKKGVRFRNEDGKDFPVVPVRFIRACPRGHVGDIRWKDFVHNEQHAKCPNRNLFVDEYGASGDISDIVIRCGCKATRPLIEATKIDLKPLGHCDGNRPWLGLRQNEDCDQRNKLLIRTASNVYFPQTISVISIPESASPVEAAVESVFRDIEWVVQASEIETHRRNPRIGDTLKPFTNEQIWAELERRKSGQGSPTKPVKQAELETLLRPTDTQEIDDPDKYFNAKALPEREWHLDAPWMDAVERVVLVHKMREVVAQVGFTRFEPKMSDINGEPDFDLGVETAALSKGEGSPWFPAYENRGEGIFISFKESVMSQWLQKSGVTNRITALNDGFDIWKNSPEHEGTQRTFPGGSYYLLHSLSHLLISSIALECGYPASSIKERIYSMPGIGYGILLYTGTADSEGTLGGIIEVGRNIKEHLKIALDSGRLCSNDPVCVQHDVKNVHDNRHLLGAACHGCLLISETSCEQQNEFLDRSLVVPTVANIGSSFFGAI